jgi:hypothetical protein
MSRFGLVGPSYASQSPNLDAEMCMNLYVEQDDGGAGNAPLAMYPTPGTAVFANLQTGGTLSNGIGAYDKSGAATGTGTAISTGALTPANSNTFALFLPLPNAGAITPGSGWVGYGPQPNIYSQVFPTATPITGAATVAPTETWVAGLVLFQLFGAAKPTIRNSVNQSGGFAPPTTYTSTLVTLPGDTIVFANLGTSSAGASAGITLTDNQGNVYNHIIHGPSGIGGPQLDVFILQNAPGGNVIFTIGGSGFPFGGWASFGYAIEAGSGVSVTGPIRGEFFINGRAFVVAGPGFVELLSNGTFTIWGEVSNDGLPVTMAASPQQLLLASAGTAYVFDLMANTLTPIPGVTFDGPVAQANICDDFFLLTIQNSKEFYVSAPLDATDWVTNGSAIVSVFPDNIVSMLVFQRQVWFFSDTQSVVYYDSGNIFPFDVNPNAFIEAGSAAENSPAIFNNSIAWLGSDARGAGKVWLANGYTPTRISNHAIEFAIQSYTKISDAVGFSYQDQGHEFYALYFPTPSVMWLYDAMTGMWHQRGFFVTATGQFQAAHYQNHIFAFGKHLVGDWQSANVYQMAIPSSNGAGGWNFVTDAGNPIVRVRRAPHISREQKWQFHTELQVFLEAGLGPTPPLLDGSGKARDPQIMLRWSDDSAHTWSSSIAMGCGQSGNYDIRVRWLRLGRARDRVYEISMSDPIPWRIVDGYLQTIPGTGI